MFITTIGKARSPTNNWVTNQMMVNIVAAAIVIFCVAKFMFQYYGTFKSATDPLL